MSLTSQAVRSAEATTEASRSTTPGPVSGCDDLPSGFESRLIDAIQPLRFFMLAINLYQLFETGLYDLLVSAGSASPAEAANSKNLDASRVEIFFKYLRNEGVLEENDGVFTVTRKGHDLAESRPWYTMFVGGYAETFLQLGDKLQLGSGFASRDLAQVGSGSCGISHYDAIPLTRRLMQMVPGDCSRLLDMGCGNGLYLVEFCKAFPEIEMAVGVEPSAKSCEEAAELIKSHGLQDRVQIVHSPAAEFLSSDFEFEPDFAVFGFILHEILGQGGESEMRRFLVELVNRFPDLNLIVIEVDNQIDNPAVMQHGLGQAYYNPYYLLHPFTNQRLETQAFWERIFAECGLAIRAKEFADSRVDSTGLEVGYLLHKA
ncbi:2-ketoarginine methyltransferase [Stieleria marina]|uniref:2-ketoarginine methyltransferase n=1 Tax=Stieleria marina TaxID=1930275 RepID=A0A517P0K7_9BACT|nr:2-ketoarginine methyltransferase [Planctomycetes bacterium K23_9]